MRTKGKFPELINILMEDIKYYQNSITSGEAAPDRHEELMSVIFETYLDIAQAQYSNGANRSEMAATLKNTIPAFENSFQYVKGFGQYDEMIWLLSMSILCEIPDEDFAKITAIIERDKANDALISTLIRYKNPDWPNSQAATLQKHPYAKSVNLQTEKDIKNYLDKVWYQGHSDAAWYDTHKNKEVNCYSGYWAWETAALAKIRKIDDASLKKQQYYPYDAVHW